MFSDAPLPLQATLGGAHPRSQRAANDLSQSPNGEVDLTNAQLNTEYDNPKLKYNKKDD